jgi:uncharacterized membrane protein
MYHILEMINFTIPFIAAIFLFWGFYKKINLMIILSLWLSLFALVSHYQLSGSEILGGYFNYLRAIIYSINLIVLAVAAYHILANFKSSSLLLNSVYSGLKVILFFGFIVLFANLWVNAYFIEQRMENTPVIQVATLKSNQLCKYKYIFYIVNKEGELHYLCPNRFFLLPSIGKVKTKPEFLIQQLPVSVIKSMKSEKS